MATIRQVYPIAELGKASDEQTNSPEFMRLKASSGYPVIDEKDVRNEVLAHIFDKGNPNPQRILSFDISVSDTGKRSGFVFFTGLLEVVWVYLDHFRAPATCRSGLSGAGIPRLAVRMHVAG
jgi:hypothetical protein